MSHRFSFISKIISSFIKFSSMSAFQNDKSLSSRLLDYTFLSTKGHDVLLMYVHPCLLLSMSPIQTKYKSKSKAKNLNSKISLTCFHFEKRIHIILSK